VGVEERVRENRTKPRPAAHDKGFWPTAIVLAACVVVSVSARLTDTDFWQHLAVGRAIWETGGIPHQHLWSWPSYGQSEVLPSWLFCAALWPIWSLGQLTGLFLWRWLSALAIFAVCILASRELRPTSSVSLLIPALCALVFRVRSQIRPETVAVLLLVIEIWLLESRRSRGIDPTRWLVLLACVWVNVHISFPLCLVVLLAYAMPEWLRSRPTGGAVRGRGLLRTMAFVALAFLINPFGWRACLEPLRYFTSWRNEPLYRSIAELHSIDWRFHARDGLPILMLLWPALQLIRAVVTRGDPVEFLLWGFFTWLAWLSQRFLGMWAAVAAIFLGRDFAWLVEERLLSKRRAPRGLVAFVTCMLMIVLGMPEWSRADVPLGIRVDPLAAPVAACDFMQRHSIRGRMFNHFELGGYLLWRFWPQRDRLPFMDIHQSGGPGIRLVYEGVMSNRRLWRRAADRFGFEVAVLQRMHARGDSLLDFLDEDTTFRMVFADDVAAVYVRAQGDLRNVADSLGFRTVPGGARRLEVVGEQVLADSVCRWAFRSELGRMVRESTANSTAHSLLATLDILAGDWESARAHLEAAHRVDPLLPRYFARLAQIEQAEGHVAAAERSLHRAIRSRE